MKLRQLHYFVSIAEAGSFTAAAREIGVAQPALSQHVIALEKELGATLFEREARGIRLTPSGATFLEHAYVVLRDVERARDAVTGKGAEIVGQVAIGLPPTIATVLALPLLEAAFARLPRVTLHLVESHSGFLREWLEISRLDLALMLNVANAKGLDLTPVIVEDLQLISSMKSGGSTKQITVSEIEKHDILIASRSHDFRKSIEDAVFLATGRPLQVRAEVDSVPTIKRMVMAGLGHTILPHSAVHEELENGTLRAQRIINPTIERHALLGSVARLPKSRAQQAIAALLIDVSRRLIADGKWVGRSLSAL